MRRATASAYSYESEWTSLPGMSPTLTPMQRKSADDLLAGMAEAEVSVLRAAAGMGKTTVLRELQAEASGKIVMAQRLLAVLKSKPAARMEEVFREALGQATPESSIVLVEDVGQALQAAIDAGLARAKSHGTKFVFATRGDDSAVAHPGATSWNIHPFEAADFAWICRHYLGEASDLLDFETIHRLAPGMSGYQLKDTCLWLGLQAAEPDTEAFIDYLRSRDFIPNVDAVEVH